jgi:hypothetical protein
MASSIDELRGLADKEGKLQAYIGGEQHTLDVGDPEGRPGVQYQKDSYSSTRSEGVRWVRDEDYVAYTEGPKATSAVGSATSGERIDGNSRHLSSSEVGVLKEVYGDLIDYTKVVVHNGLSHDAADFGFRLWMSKANSGAVTIGNDIYIANSSYFTDNQLSLSGSGVSDLLVHEMGHIWQFQTGGPAYIINSGVRQTLPVLEKAVQHGTIDLSARSQAYSSWRASIAAGVPWSEMGAEEQASLIGAYSDAASRAAAGDAMAAEDLALLTPYILQVRAGTGATRWNSR